MEESEMQRIRRMRNATMYQGIRNSIIEWMISDRWTEVPGRMHVRGVCIERMLGPTTRIERFVVQGSVSGEFTCK